MYFRESKDSLANPLLIDRKHWTQAMNDALGMHQDGGFPFQLSLANNPTKPIPAVVFSKKIQTSIGDVLNKELKIYVTPTEFFTTKFRQIFKNTRIQFTTSKYARKVAWWPPHELLATASKLCSVVRNNRLWNFSRYTVLLQL